MQPLSFLYTYTPILHLQNEGHSLMHIDVGMHVPQVLDGADVAADKPDQAKDARNTLIELNLQNRHTLQVMPLIGP